MKTLELSTNHHGVIAEAITGRYAGFPDPLRSAIEEHISETYSELVPEGSSVALHSCSRDITSESTLATIDDIDLPDSGEWGYSSGWIPDDIISASWFIYNQEVGEYYPEAQRIKKASSNRSPPLGQIRTHEGTRVDGTAKVYYLIEVKSVTTGNRVWLTENQHEMMKIASETLDFVHPVIVILDLGNLPNSVDIAVDVYADSVWGDGARSKTV